MTRQPMPKRHAARSAKKTYQESDAEFLSPTLAQRRVSGFKVTAWGKFPRAIPYLDDAAGHDCFLLTNSATRSDSLFNCSAAVLRNSELSPGFCSAKKIVLEML